MSSGYALHPEAFADLDDIRDLIAQANPIPATEIIGTRRPSRRLDAVY